MGSKQSRAVSNNSTKITEVSKNTLNLLNEQINDITASSMIQNSSAAVSSTIISQDLNFSGCKIKGDINITGGGQDAKAFVNFDAVEVSKVENEVAQEMLNNITAKIKNSLDSDTVATMDAAAEASLKSGWNPFNGKVDTKTSNKFNLNVNTDNTQNIQNVIKQAINTNFDVESSQKCVDEQKISQEVDFKDCSALNLNIKNYTQNASVENLGECMLKQGIANTVINKAASSMGVEATSDDEIKAKVEQKAKSKSTLVETGLLGASGSSFCIIFVIGIAYFIFNSTSPSGETDPTQLIIACISCLVCLSVMAGIGYGIYELEFAK